MWIRSEDGVLINLDRAEMVYATQVSASAWQVVAVFGEQREFAIATADTEEDAEYVVNEIADALATRGQMRALTTLPRKQNAPAKAEAL
jgi:hypothetical protein